MKKMVIAGLAMMVMLALSSKAFALIEKQPIIEKNLSSEYQNTKIIL